MYRYIRITSSSAAVVVQQLAFYIFFMPYERLKKNMCLYNYLWELAKQYSHDVETTSTYLRSVDDAEDGADDHKQENGDHGA